MMHKLEGREVPEGWDQNDFGPFSKQLLDERERNLEPNPTVPARPFKKFLSSQIIKDKRDNRFQMHHAAQAVDQNNDVWIIGFRKGKPPRFIYNPECFIVEGQPTNVHGRNFWDSASFEQLNRWYYTLERKRLEQGKPKRPGLSPGSIVKALLDAGSRIEWWNTLLQPQQQQFIHLVYLELFGNTRKGMKTRHIPSATEVPRQHL